MIDPTIPRFTETQARRAVEILRHPEVRAHMLRNVLLIRQCAARSKAYPHEADVRWLAEALIESVALGIEDLPLPRAKILGEPLADEAA